MSRIPLDFIKVDSSISSRGWSMSDHDHSPPNQHSRVSRSEQEHVSDGRGGEQKQHRHMDIDRDEAEAGSILISLASYSPHRRAQETKRPSSIECRRPMSIQSLLDTKPDQRNNISSSSSHQEATSHEPIMNISEHRRDEMHTRAPEERYGPKINSVKQESTFMPFDHHERTMYSQTTENLAKHHHLIMRPYQSHPMTDLGNYDDPKQNPKIKRNALHAYISYMIYTDLSNHQKPFNGKLATPKGTPTGFAVVMNNDNSNHSSGRSAYPFPSMTFQKMSNILSNDVQRTESTSVSSHQPFPTSTGSMPLLFGQRDNGNSAAGDASSHHHQVPQVSNSILHKPLTAYLRTATTQQHTEQYQHQHREAPPVPSPEGFKPRPYASMPLLPGMPPNHGRKF